MSLNSSVNNTRPAIVVIVPDIPPITIELAIYLVTVLVCLVGLVGNGIIIHLFCFRIKLNQSTVYILNLAVADFIFVFGCCMVSLYFLWEYNRVQTLSESHTIFSRFGDVLHSFGFNSSLFFLATLSIEQCVSVRFPMWYKCHRPEHLSAIMCGILWVVIVLITVLERFLSHEYRQTVYIVISSIYLVVTLAIVGASAILIIELQKTSMQCRPLKLYIVVIAAIITFLISLVPITTVRFLFSLGLLNTATERLISFCLVFLCTAIDSTAHPYIYINMGKWKKSISNTKALESAFKEEGGRSSEESHSADTQQTDIEHQSSILQRN
ncbi:proto-oncogene Mas-like [Eleutherodactylus coqui]|uniref:proto-oncogene Mas-like n=1 Tax=Eleutherodactylus coqui TaxID=57060 RepID=UPI0034619D5E